VPSQAAGGPGQDSRARQACGLERETPDKTRQAILGATKPGQERHLISWSALPAERKYFEGEWKGRNQRECDRVELNAITSLARIAFLERKFREAGAAAEVIPPMKVLQNHEKARYTRAIREWVHQKAAALLGFDRITDAVACRFAPKLRTASPERFMAALRGEPAKSWRAVVEASIAGGIDQHEADMLDILEQQLQHRAAAFARRTRGGDRVPQ
jgi:hypothetical protein